MKNYILRYGIYGAAALTFAGLFNWFAIAPNFSVSTSQSFGYLGIILCLLCIPMGIKHFRDQLNSGAVTFGKAFKIGISITGIVAFIMFFYGMLFFVFQGAEFQEWQFKDLQGEDLEAMKAQIDAMPDFAMTPWFQGVVMVIMTFSMGFGMTLLSSFILRSRGK